MRWLRPQHDGAALDDGGALIEIPGQGPLHAHAGPRQSACGQLGLPPGSTTTDPAAVTCPDCLADLAARRTVIRMRPAIPIRRRRRLAPQALLQEAQGAATAQHCPCGRRRPTAQMLLCALYRLRREHGSQPPGWLTRRLALLSAAVERCPRCGQRWAGPARPGGAHAAAC